MPRCDGLEATRRIRNMEAAAAERKHDEQHGGGEVPHAFIIGLTANASEEDRADCLQSGMDSFLCVASLSLARSLLCPQGRPEVCVFD